MKNQSLTAVKFLVAAAMSLGYVGSSRAEADATAQISINNGTVSTSGGTIVFSNFTAKASATSGTAGQTNTGFTPTASASSTYSSANGSATIPNPVSFNVSGVASATGSIPGVTVGTSTAEGKAGASGFFSVTGGTGTVTVTFSIPITGFTSTFISANGDIVSASDTFTLALLTAGGTSINSQMFSINSGTLVGSPGSPSTPNTITDTVILNYNQQYQVNLLADAVINITNVPEPTTTALLGFGLVLGVFMMRKGAKKAA